MANAQKFWLRTMSLLLVISLRSCEAIQAKAAELKEFCHSKSFNIQPLIPTIKVQHCFIILITCLLIIKLRMYKIVDF